MKFTCDIQIDGLALLAIFLTIIFTVLKFYNIIAWSWFWVFAPIWIYFSLVIILIIILFIIEVIL